MYTFLQNEQLLNPNQSGFRLIDSCISQLLSITHEIFQSFDATLPSKVRSVFLDISKAFDKVWQEGLLYKLNSIGISSKFYRLVESYLSNSRSSRPEVLCKKGVLRNFAKFKKRDSGRVPIYIYIYIYMHMHVSRSLT